MKKDLSYPSLWQWLIYIHIVIQMIHIYERVNMSHFYNEGYIKCFSLVILLLLSDNSCLLYYFEMLNNTYRLCDQWIILPLVSIYSYYNYNYFSIAFFKISYLLYWKSDIINYPFIYNFLKVFKNNSRQILLENIKKKNSQDKMD